MPSSVPPVLSPYVTPAPQGSLTLVTSVLDAASNWLLLRYVHENFKVIFVSVLRGFEQWREMGKKVVREFFPRTLQRQALISSSLLKSIPQPLRFIFPFGILILVITLEGFFLRPK
jgi:hypothetical protein